MGERLTDEELANALRWCPPETSGPDLVRSMATELRERRAQDLNDRDRELLDWGLGVLTSDYNDVPHDEIAALRARLKSRPACEEVERLTSALRKVSDIRDSIVGMQGFNFSEHAYPLVAVLNGAGFKGVGYEIARKNLGTLIEQAKAAGAERDVARAEVERWRRTLPTIIADYIARWADTSDEHGPFIDDLPRYVADTIGHPIPTSQGGK